MSEGKCCAKQEGMVFPLHCLIVAIFSTGNSGVSEAPLFKNQTPRITKLKLVSNEKRILDKSEPKSSKRGIK